MDQASVCARRRAPRPLVLWNLIPCHLPPWVTLLPVRRVRREQPLLGPGGNLSDPVRIARAVCLSLLQLALLVPFTSTAQENAPPNSSSSQISQDWPRYGGNAENNHYSPLEQINRSNVAKLQVAWTFDTGEEGGLQTNPLIVNGVLYGITPTQKIF